MSDFPSELQINAFAADAENRSAFEPSFGSGLLATPIALSGPELAPVPLDFAEWEDDRVGWGIVLPDDETLAADAKAHALDAPEIVQALLIKRRGIAMRYRAGTPTNMLWRYYPDGTSQKIMVTAQAWGRGVGRVPRYLMLLGSPEILPWRLQFGLQADCYVGRVDLSGDALDRYVQRLIDDWSGAGADETKPLIWSPAQSGDITRLMRDCIAAPLFEKFRADGGLTPAFIDGTVTAATGDALAEGLADQRPAFVATTSHGMTGPLSDSVQMKSDLGVLVDANLKIVAPDKLLAAWQPDGAIWYAHACCSAGSQSATSFSGLVVAGSSVDRILRAVAGCGNTVAPFPQALLSAEKPARAFVGHVEPTFDWSVRQRDTGQFLTDPLLDSFYQRLFSGEPIGMALDSCRRMAGGLLINSLEQAETASGEGQSVAGEILANRLMARDWRAFVLLGDPACRLN